VRPDGQAQRIASGLALVLLAGVLGTLQFGGEAGRGGLALVLVGAVVAFVGACSGTFPRPDRQPHN
jgi:hypothetical protein